MEHIQNKHKNSEQGMKVFMPWDNDMAKSQTMGYMIKLG